LARVEAGNQGPWSSVAWMNVVRAASILTVLFKNTAGCLRDGAVRRWPVLRRFFPSPILPPERLRQVFEELGGTYIKFGQMLALQPDILSLEYCNALFNLLDRVAPFSYEQVERIFLEEFGRKPDELFDSFDAEPLATASIGQVHIAWLRGRKLAVKVQRPTVDRDFAGDIRLMSAAIWLIRKLRLRMFHWMIEPMSEFIGWTREELDYRYEARYLRQLRHNARSNPNEIVPELLDEFTTRRTLVMEFLEGCTVLGYLRALERGDELIDKLEANGFDSHQVAAHIIGNFLGDAFQHGLFHADLHPANLMILTGNRVGYIDFGITGTISSYSRQNLVALTLAYTRGDLPGMCEAFFRVSAMDAGWSADLFREGLARDAKSWYQSDGKTLHLRKNFTLVMLDMLRLSRRTGVWPERDVIKYIRSAIAIDGLITRFSPTFDLGTHLQAVCERYLKWRQRKSFVSFDNLLTSALPLGRLFHDGGLRAAAALEKLAPSAFDRWSEPEGRQAGAAALRARTVYLASFVFTISFAISMSPGKIQLGVNLFTSEVILGAGGFLLLLNTVRKLSKGEFHA
jgi:predicted unusual protein kinase regulating ubiquinone biosynthesis (AarF/ABC1/UbiB family)